MPLGMDNGFQLPHVAWNLSKYLRCNHIPPRAINITYNRGSTGPVSRHAAKHSARQVFIDQRPPTVRLLTAVQMAVRLPCGHNRCLLANCLRSSLGQMVILHRHPHRSTFHKCPPVQRRAARPRAPTCRSYYKTAARLVSQIHSAHHNRRHYHMLKVLIAQTRRPALQAHQSNILRQTHPVPRTAYQYITTSTAHTLLSHPAPPTGLLSPLKNTALRLLYQHTCPLQRPHQCASPHHHRKCPHRSCLILFPRL
jgi:hypothetical protein